MKRLFIAAIALTASTLSYAQSTTQPAKTTPVAVESGKAAPATVNQDECTPVKIEELPAPVRKELGTTQYKNWTPTVAYWVKDGKSSFYEITLANGDESKKVKYNAEGSKLD